MRKLATAAAVIMLSACAASPTEPLQVPAMDAARLSGFTMGSGNRTEDGQTTTATTSSNAVADSTAAARSPFTMGSGN